MSFGVVSWEGVGCVFLSFYGAIHCVLNPKRACYKKKGVIIEIEEVIKYLRIYCVIKYPQIGCIQVELPIKLHIHCVDTKKKYIIEYRSSYK